LETKRCKTILLLKSSSLWFDRFVVDKHIETSVSNTARTDLENGSGVENEAD
jgi:hypothetical protein